MDNQNWQDLTQICNLQNEQDCKNLVDLLVEASIENFKLESSFAEQYQLKEFLNQWDLQNDDEQNNIEKTKYKGKNFIQRPKDYPKEEIMDLGKEQLRSKVFIESYKEEIEHMEYSYKIKILSNRSKIHIYMQNGELNLICRNKLTDMNHKLSIFYGRQKNLIVILSASGKLQKKLADMGVNVWFRCFRGSFLGLFYTISMDMTKMMLAIQEVTRFDVANFNFNHKSLTKTTVIGVMKVLQDSQLNTVKKLEKNYQLQIQFDLQSCFINMHYRHASFGKQPLAELKQKLNSLVIFSIKTKNIRTFDNKVKKIIKKLPFLSEKMNNSRRQTFLAINVGILINSKHYKKQMEEFLKLFVGIIENDMEIRVFFNYITNPQPFMRRVLEISEQNNLILRNQSFSEFTEMSAIFGIKDCSQIVLMKRQKQISLFIQRLITPPQSDNSKNESITDSFISQDPVINSIQTAYVQNQSISHILQPKYKMNWLKLEYKLPKLRKFDGEDRDFIKDRRLRDMQTLLNQQGSFKFKVWNLQLSENLRIPEKLESFPLLLSKPFKGFKLNGSYEMSTLESFKVKEEGVIAFISSEVTDDFVPVIVFQRIS